MSATEAPTVLAVDLGGTSMKGAVVDVTGRIVSTRARPTPPTEIVSTVAALLSQLREDAMARGRQVVGAGVVTPGTVDEQRGVVAYASNLRWNDVALGDDLTRALGMPVGVGHDVRAAGLAEGLVGAARNARDFLLVTIGTGVAAAVVSAGAPLIGASSAAGEFGHIPVVYGGEPCVCGQRGCLEVYVSGGGVARRYAAAGGQALSAREVVGRLPEDPRAQRIWADAVDALAQGLTIATLLIDPEVIVIGGGFSRAGEALMEPLGRQLSAGLAWRGAPRLVRSTLGDDAGYLGAAVHAFRSAGMEHVVHAWGEPSTAA